MKVRVSLLLAAFLLLLVGCGSEPEEPVILGEAYVGPYELEILEELSPESPISARLPHGEIVQITARRRRFARIRTKTGIEGWTDGRMLLTVAQMARLRHLSMNAGRSPSQGKATVYDVLNIHTAPNRQAPSFYQMLEGVLGEAVAHQLVLRGPFTPLEDDDPGVWPVNSYAAPGEGPVANHDEWTLIRLPDGRSGWALSRMLVMAIPDEVAQYAEGHRITSYFSLGRVEDNGIWKHHWLWTTKRSRNTPYQFDSFRVFVWSLRRHRYETAYIARNVIGYYPTEATPMSVDENGRRIPAEFVLILREDDGSLWKKTFTFQGYRVHQTDKERWRPARQETRAMRQTSIDDLEPANDSPLSILKGKLNDFVDEVMGKE